MKRRATFSTILATTLVTWIVTFASSSLTSAAVLIDDFSASQTVWDGVTVDVSGTIWDGMQGTGFAEFANTNDTNPGELTIRKNSTSNSGSSAPFDSAALYVNVTGDFDAKVEMPGFSGLNAIPYRTHSLAAWTNDQSQAVHLDNILGTTNTRRFRDLVPSDEFADDGGGTNGWFRLERIGDSFNGYWGTNGTSWTLLETIDTSGNPYGSTLRVGLATWNDSSSDFGARFDNFEIETGPGTPTASFTWTATTGGDWNASQNWTVDGPPNGGHDAIFADSIAATSTVFADTPVSVRSVQFDSSIPYAIAGRGGINLVPGTDAAGQVPARFDVLQGSHEFQARVNLLHDATATITSGAMLIMNNALDLGGNRLTKTGAGELAIRNDLITNGGAVDLQQGLVSGNGTIGGDLNNDGGTISPGNSNSSSLVPEPTSLMMIGLATLSSLMCWRRI